jgi:hypothetical protein
VVVVAMVVMHGGCGGGDAWGWFAVTLVHGSSLLSLCPVCALHSLMVTVHPQSLECVAQRRACPRIQ